jgi:hypothetical protein
MGIPYKTKQNPLQPATSRKINSLNCLEATMGRISAGRAQNYSTDIIWSSQSDSCNPFPVTLHQLITNSLQSYFMQRVRFSSIYFILSFITLLMTQAAYTWRFHPSIFYFEDDIFLRCNAVYLVEAVRRFRGVYCLHLQGWQWRQYASLKRRYTSTRL